MSEEKNDNWKFKKFSIETKSYGEFQGLQVGQVEFEKAPSGLNGHILLNLPQEATEKMLDVIRPHLTKEIQKLTI